MLATLSAHPNLPAAPHPTELRAAAERLATPAQDRELLALEHELTRLSANLNAAEYRFLVLLEEFHRLGGHVGVGIKSCAHWLNWRCAMSLGAARERVRVALALPGLPLIAEAFSTGELSFSKVRATTRVATPANQTVLLRLARSGTASQLERAVRGYRRAQLGEEAKRAERQHAHRELRCWYDDDGSLVIRGRLPPEQGALVLKALEAAVDSLPRLEGPAASAQFPRRRPAGSRTRDSRLRLSWTRPTNRSRHGAPTRWPAWRRPSWQPSRLPWRAASATR
jgi:hypothetical protein